MLILITGFSILNIFVILSYKLSLDYQIKKEAILLKKLYIFSENVPLPSYVYIGSNPPEGFTPVEKIDNKVIAFDLKGVNRKLKNFALTLFIWEGAIILALFLIFYKTVIKYIKKEEEIKKFLELMLLTITHKLGNFLSIYRVNIEILNEKCESKALKRLENAYAIMEKDFSFVTRSLKKLSFHQKEEKKINLKNKILEVLSFFGQSIKDKKVIISLSDVYVKMDEQELENILFSVFENIAKYSYKNIHIKMCKNKKYVYIFIKNDFKSVSKGSGIGLKLAEFLISQYNGDLRTRVKKSFLTVLILPIFSSRFINEKV